TPLTYGSSITGSFATPQSGVQMFRVTLPNAHTPFQVWTQDLDPNINTDIKLYRAHYVVRFLGTIPIQVVDRYDQLPNASANFDYFPADRSSIDAKIVVNNWHVLDNAWTDDPNTTDYSPGANTIYVAVKNEQGTQGSFQFNAGPVAV